MNNSGDRGKFLVQGLPGQQVQFKARLGNLVCSYLKIKVIAGKLTLPGHLSPSLRAILILTWWKERTLRLSSDLYTNVVQTHAYTHTHK